ncbi:nitrite reductase [Desulfomicrobium baculatum]|uniref:Nitrite and sulphite reductase 4Fe-4S region n=1 Tax=Desulfomicrobium baculatum (strain DSM 4028 / VKM B-1378 / X) TaxID=525897 RepID=C7LUB0_DESBD|nr:nitrite reductase [Desulfomicrobium baculatum]ACU89645.1 nitrite and sulphite reductase 4Fe-4S region [Desulfomicrobium baculatum DSM 4028]
MNTVSESITIMPLERKDGTFALRLCLSQGELSIAMLRRVMDVMTAYGLPTLRATTGQRMNLEGVPKDKLDEIVAALGTAVEKCPPGVSVCPGSAECRYGKQETRKLGRKLTSLVKENGPYPFKVKTGVSGCSFGCGLSFVRDIGLVGKSAGWDLYFGGSATFSPGPGVALGKKLSEDEVLDRVRKALAFYKENGRKRERIGSMVRRLGHEAVAESLK